MKVAVKMEFKADRKEPLGDLVRRAVALFEQNGIEPRIAATFSDGPGGIRSTSAVERALRKHPHLARFERGDAPLAAAGLPPIRRLTNEQPGDPFPIADILALADGVPRSLPFHAVNVHLEHTEFGEIGPLPGGPTPQTGIAISDSWWINGRNRGLSALYAVEADPKSKTLPDPPPAIGAILAGLGKPRRKSQLALPGVAPAAAAVASTQAADPAQPAVARDMSLIAPIVATYRREMPSLIQRIGLPHDLPPAAEVRLTSLGATGPLKPTLVEAFSRRGYDCHGGSGTFTIRRRTAANHVIDVELDVGTWSRSVTFMFHLKGPGFKATLLPPVGARADARQYPIGDTANWERIVANIGAIADELERTFVREIEAIVDPAPAWFEPGR
jgi:hypothetical protein